MTARHENQKLTPFPIPHIFANPDQEKAAIVSDHIDHALRPKGHPKHSQAKGLIRMED
jgi:hypothetical protein